MAGMRAPSWISWYLAIVLVAGCSKSAGHSPDAGSSGDGAPGIDAPPPDAPPPGPITIWYSPSNPQVDGMPLPVIFSAPDGSIYGTSMLDGNGQVTGDVPSGGSVTVLETVASDVFAFSVGGVQPGEVLHLGPTAPPRRAFITAALPSSYPMATEYNMEIAPCGETLQGGSDSTQAWFAIDDACAARTRSVTVSVIASTGSPASPTAFTIATVPIYDASGNLLSPNVTLPAWRTDFAQYAVSFTGVPAGTASIDGVVQPQVSSQILGTATASANADLGGGPAAISVSSLPPDVTESTWLMGRVNYQFVRRRVPNQPTTMTLDLSALPPAVACTMDQTDPARSLVKWNVQPPADVISTYFVEYDWGLAWSITWEIVLPPQAQYQFPELPAAYGAFRPKKIAAGSVFGSAMFKFRTASFAPPSYADLLAQGVPDPNSLLVPIGGEQGSDVTTTETDCDASP
jgi:hypothetical protein